MSTLWTANLVYSSVGIGDAKRVHATTRNAGDHDGHVRKTDTRAGAAKRSPGPTRTWTPVACLETHVRPTRVWTRVACLDAGMETRVWDTRKRVPGRRLPGHASHVYTRAGNKAGPQNNDQSAERRRGDWLPLANEDIIYLYRSPAISQWGRI